MIQDISKTLNFRFFNKFTKQEIFSVSMPYIPFKATNAFYSNLFKRFKEAAAFQFEKSLVKGKYWFDTQKTERVIIKFPFGASIDMPHTVTNKDIAIINHYMEGAKMSLQK